MGEKAAGTFRQVQLTERKALNGNCSLAPSLSLFPLHRKRGEKRNLAAPMHSRNWEQAGITLAKPGLIYMRDICRLRNG